MAVLALEGKNITKKKPSPTDKEGRVIKISGTGQDSGERFIDASATLGQILLKNKELSKRHGARVEDIDVERSKTKSKPCTCACSIR